MPLKENPTNRPPPLFFCRGVFVRPAASCTAEGRSRAKARGQHMGRPPKLTPQQQKEARRRRAEGATLKELAKSYNVGRATISRLSA
jgi:DNA invertase Pin-like site-specific DNA recombinase